MAFEQLQAVVGVAIVDSRFRRQLLLSAPNSLSEFDLSQEEAEAISTIRQDTFAGFATELDSWMSRRSVMIR